MYAVLSWHVAINAIVPGFVCETEIIMLGKGVATEAVVFG